MPNPKGIIIFTCHTVTTLYAVLNCKLLDATFVGFQQVKVVIIGQDPYHGPNQAHGMCFSVRVGVAVPPSLQNMYKELCNSVPEFKRPGHGYLMGWAKQGVLLLNACLTVRHKEPNSHSGKVCTHGNLGM